MRIQYMSNLYVDLINPFKIRSITTPYLALLGNIGNPYCKKTRDFIGDCSSKWEKVFWVYGPHEYTFVGNENKRKYNNNVYIMNNKTHSLYSGHNLIGSSLLDNTNTDIKFMEFEKNFSSKNIYLSHRLYDIETRGVQIWLFGNDCFSGYLTDDKTFYASNALYNDELIMNKGFNENMVVSLSIS